MGWEWSEEANGWPSSAGSTDINEFENPNSNSGDRCSTRKVVTSKCKTQEVEPGKFVRKCEKTEQILRDCVGRPVEVVQSNKEYTEDDVTDEVIKGSFPMESSELRPFDFPGLRSDIEAIERSLFGGISRFFEAAEEMRNGFFNVFGSPHVFDESSSSPSSSRRGIPIEGLYQKEASSADNNSDSGNIDLAGLARDV